MSENKIPYKIYLSEDEITCRMYLHFLNGFL